MLYLVILASSIAVSLKVHMMADLRFPPPWADESYFLWQAINVAERDSLFAPQLNPERVIMMQVPGYQILMGMLFKIIPFSLETARAVSWLLALVAYLGLLWLFRGRTPFLLIIVAASFWYLGSHFVVLGNTARMEALHLVLIVAAFAFFDAGKPYKALAILLLCPLVHPNGVIFLGFGLLYMVWQGSRRCCSPSRLDYTLLTLFLLCIIGYIVFTLFNWQAFLSDMAYQFGDKAKHYVLTVTLRQPRIFIPILVILAISAMHIFLFKTVKPLVVLAVCLLLPQIIADELFYGIYTSLAFLTAIPLSMDIVAESVKRMKLANPRFTMATISTFLVAGLLVIAYQIGFIESPLGYPRHIMFGGMKLRVYQPYLTPEDKQQIIKAVQAQVAGSSSDRVGFWPVADSLLYWPEKERGFLPYDPLFTQTKPEVVVFHTSRYIPGWWQPWVEEFWEVYQFAESDMVRRRDNTEAWYVKKVSN